MASARKKTRQPTVLPGPGLPGAIAPPVPAKAPLPLMGNQYRSEWKDAIPKWPYYPFQEIKVQQAKIADELCERDPVEFNDYDWAMQIAETRLWVIPSPAAVRLIHSRLEEIPWNPHAATNPGAWHPVALALKHLYGIVDDVIPWMSIHQVLLRLSSSPPPRPPSVRLFFDPDRKLAWLDKEEIRVPNFGQIAVLKAAILKGGSGGIFFWTDLKTTEASRPEQTVKRLPLKLRTLFVPAGPTKKSGCCLAVRARLGSPENSQ